MDQVLAASLRAFASCEGRPGPTSINKATFNAVSLGSLEKDAFGLEIMRAW